MHVLSVYGLRYLLSYVVAVLCFAWIIVHSSLSCLYITAVFFSLSV